MSPDLCLNPRFIEKDEIERNLPKIIGIFHQYEVSFAYIFGSILYAEGSNDLDIGVFFKEKKRSSLELYTDLYFDLCSVFKADNIDVAILNETGPAFKFEVMSKGDLVYFLHHREVVEFIERTLFDYEDTRRFRRESHEELTASVREGLMKERKVNVQQVDTFLKNLKEALRDIQRLISPIENIKRFPI